MLFAAASIVFAQETPPAAPPMQGPSSSKPASVMPLPCPVSSLHIISGRAIRLLTARLDLTDDQKTKVENLLTKADDELKPVIEEQKKANERYTKLLLSNDTSESDLNAAAMEAMKVEPKIMAQKIKTLVALRALLNDDQKTKLNTILGQFSLSSPVSVLVPKLALSSDNSK